MKHSQIKKKSNTGNSNIISENCHEVVQDDEAVLRGEGRLQDVAAAQVLPHRLETLGRADREEVPAPPVEQAREGRIGIEALQAGPVDRAIPGDQGAALAIAQRA